MSNLSLKFMQIRQGCLCWLSYWQQPNRSLEFLYLILVGTL